MARRRRPLSTAEIDQQAITIVRGEKQRWEVATAFVTDRVSFKMRQLIRIFRKNYYGIFDEPKDPYTGLEKIWYPLTEINVEAVVKNIDLDTKDIGFRSKTKDGQWMTDITRAHVKDKLGRMYFGEKLDQFERMLAIDGTAVWKTYEVNGKMIVQLVDLLNIYIDPTSPSIQESYRFTERSLMDVEAVEQMTGWRNTEGLKPVEGLPRTDPYWMNRATQVNSNVKELDVYELWGKIPSKLITGEFDAEDEVDGHIVVSGIDSPGNEKVHLIELNTKKDAEDNSLKPYEEAWFTRVPNRWYGRGIAEKVLTLQIYANIVFNVRINRSRIAQLGIFKIKKGAGVTPQMLSRLPSNGAVVLNNLDDLQQLVVQEVGASSYKDEEVINELSERLTNAFSVVTGEHMPSSTPATNAVLESQSAKSGFTLIKDGIGMFLERWLDRHGLPILAKELKADFIVRFEADEDSFKQVVDKVVLHRALEALDASFGRGYLPSPQEIQGAIEHAKEAMLKGDMFITLVQRVMAEELFTKVYVTNEEMDVAVTIQNLMTMLQAAPEYRQDIISQTFDLMGLQAPKAQPMPQQPGQQPQGQPQGQPQMAAQQMQQQATQATAGQMPRAVA